MADYPAELTTSDWVDHLETLSTREEKIVALSTFHRRVDNGARVAVLDNMAAEGTDSKDASAVRAACTATKGRLSALPDYDGEPVETPKPVEPPASLPPTKGPAGKGKTTKVARGR